MEGGPRRSLPHGHVSRIGTARRGVELIGDALPRRSGPHVLGQMAEQRPDIAQRLERHHAGNDQRPREGLRIVGAFARCHYGVDVKPACGIPSHIYCCAFGKDHETSNHPDPLQCRHGLAGARCIGRHHVQAVCSLRGRSCDGKNLRMSQGGDDALLLLSQRAILPHVRRGLPPIVAADAAHVGFSSSGSLAKLAAKKSAAPD